MSGPYGYGRSAPSYDPGDPPEDGWEEREESDCPDCAKLRELLATAEARTELAERLLHDLTPTGSEFVGRPQKCFQWVSDHVSDLMRIVVDATTERRTEHEEALRLKRKLQEAEHRAEIAEDKQAELEVYIKAYEKAAESRETTMRKALRQLTDWGLSADDVVAIARDAIVDTGEGEGVSS